MIFRSYYLWPRGLVYPPERKGEIMLFLDDREAKKQLARTKPFSRSEQALIIGHSEKLVASGLFGNMASAALALADILLSQNIPCNFIGLQEAFDFVAKNPSKTTQ